MNPTNMNNHTETAATAAVVAKEAYEAKVGAEALARQGGYNPQLKGVVHEVLFRDQYNMDVKNIVKGQHAELTKSVTAIRDDIVGMNRDGSVIFRAQLKDTPESVGHTIAQVKDGKYARTTLMGTEETAAAYAEKTAKLGKDGVQQMKSTGISSKDTSRIADKALGKQVSAESILHGAGAAGTLGAAASVGMCLIDMAADGEAHSAGEVVGETVKAGATGYASGAAAFAGAEVAANAVRGAVSGVAAAGTVGTAGTAAAAILPGIAGVGGAIVAGKVATTFAKPVAEGIVDAVKYKAPEMIKFGVQDGLRDVGDLVQDTIEKIPIIGGLYDTICCTLFSWFG